MCTYRSIDPARTALTTLNWTNNLLIKGFTHAVQALKLILPSAIALWPSKFINGCQGMCIMRRKLRKHVVHSLQQLFCASDIGQISVGFARKYGIILYALYLRQLDFRIPVCPLDQA